MCFVLQEPALFLSFDFMVSPLFFLVFWYESNSSTPSMSKCSEKVMYRHAGGKSSGCRVPSHLPRRRNFTFPDVGSRWSSHPEAASKRRVSFSTRVNSATEVIAGLQSSA